MTPTSARMFAEAMRAREHACVHLDAAPPAARLRSSPSWSSAGRKQADWTYSNIFRGNTASACVTWWRNGSAFDSRSKGWGFDSLSRHTVYFCRRRFFASVSDSLSRRPGPAPLLFCVAEDSLPSSSFLGWIRFDSRVRTAPLRQNSSSSFWRPPRVRLIKRTGASAGPWLAVIKATAPRFKLKVPLPIPT